MNQMIIPFMLCRGAHGGLASSVASVASLLGVITKLGSKAGAEEKSKKVPVIVIEKISLNI